MTTLVADDRAAQQEIEFLLRIQTPNGESSEAASRLRSSAASLVKDILVSKLNVDASVDALGVVHVRGLLEADRALVACRALQVAFEGFCLAAPRGAGVSMLLDAAGPGYIGSVEQGPSVTQRDLLASAKPFQVLVTPAFFEKLQHGPLIGQRSFARRVGGYEFLWASDQRLAELQSQQEPMATVVIPMPSAPSANDINDRTFFMSDEDRLPDEIPAPQFGGLAAGAESQTRGRRRGRGLMFAGGAFALLAAVGYLGATQTDAGGQIWINVMAAIHGAPPKAQPAPPGDNPSVTPAPPEPPHIQPEPPRPKPPTVKLRTPTQPCTIGKSLVPEYTSLGTSYLNKGDLGAAKRSFGQVVACDPGNATAREGLQRIKQAQAELGKSDPK